jgi:hypothetical protein
MIVASSSKLPLQMIMEYSSMTSQSLALRSMAVLVHEVPRVSFTLHSKRRSHEQSEENGGIVGAGVDKFVGSGVVAIRGAGVGRLVGAGVGGIVGAGVGELVGAGVGRLVGAGVGEFVGAGVPGLVGAGVGGIVGAGVRGFVGTEDGGVVGDGTLVGVSLGALVGVGVGTRGDEVLDPFVGGGVEILFATTNSLGINIVVGTIEAIHKAPAESFMMKRRVTLSFKGGTVKVRSIGTLTSKICEVKQQGTTFSRYTQYFEKREEVDPFHLARIVRKWTWCTPSALRLREL